MSNFDQPSRLACFTFDMQSACGAMPFQLPRAFHAKENAMSHLAIVLLTVGAFVLILGTIRAVRAYLENRSEEMAPFRNYFGAEYDRDLFRQCSWCGDDNLYDRRTRVDALNVRDRSAIERYSGGSGTTWRNRDRD
jgi:hypothetical protein